MHGLRNRLLAGLFLITLGAPLLLLPAVSPADLTEMELAEKRRMTPFPPAPDSVEALKAFPGAFADWFGDHMGLRRTLVQTHNRVRLVALGTSPAPLAIAGNDGWHFYAHQASMRSFRHQFPFTEAQLVAWQQALEARRDWLAERGIDYLFVVVPDKSTIYGEHMPRRISRQDNPARMEQFLKHMARHSSVRVLDLTPVLAQEKKRGPLLYRKTDSHWNDRGAYFGYREIMRRVAQNFPAARPHPLTDYDLRSQTVEGGGLAGLYDLSASMTEEVPRLHPRFTPCGTQEEIEFEGNFTWFTGRGPLRTACNRPGLPRAVFFRDSFADAMIPYLSEHFTEAVYIVNPFMPEIMEQVLAGKNMTRKPDLVIEQIVQRKFYMLEPEAAPEVRQALLRSRFAGGGTPLVAIARPQGWPVRATREGQVFALPPVKTGPDRWPVVRLTVFSPQAATMRVGFQHGDADTPWNPSDAELKPGPNDLYFGLPLTGFDGRLALMPPVLEQGIVVTGLEVRAVPLDTRSPGQGEWLTD